MPGVVVFLSNCSKAEFVDFKGSLHLLTSSICGNEIICCSEPFCVGAFGTDPFLARPRRNMFPVNSVAKGMKMVIYFGLPEFALLWPLIVVIGLVVCYGMAGCLGSAVLVRGILGRLPLGIWLAVSQSVVWVLILGILLLFGPECWDADDIALEMPYTSNICTDVAGRLLVNWWV